MTPDDAVRSSLCTHMGREFAAHFQYLAMSAWLEGEGLPEMAGFFARQADVRHAGPSLLLVEDYVVRRHPAGGAAPA